MQDAAAIERCKAGDREAFGLLVRRYQTQAIGHALAILRHREDALDAVQDAFLRALGAMGRFIAGREFYPWFYTILRNRCYALLSRRRESRPAGPGDEWLLARAGRAAPEEADCDQAELLSRALAELSPEDRELITLKHLDALRYEQLAERLGIPPGTVMSRLYHARNRLREKMSRLERQAQGQGADRD